MQVPLIPFDETERLRKLESLRLPYSPIEERFEQVTRLAKSAFDVQICLVSLVGSDYQWFKSAQGLCVPETDRSISFCGHAIHGPDIFIVEDARCDARFADNPLVTGYPHIRFYAGFPLHSGEGTALGTLCLIDQKPRHLSPRELQLLRSFGNWANFQIEHTVEDTLHAGYLVDLDEHTRKHAIDPITRIWTQQSLRALFERNVQQADEIPTPYAMLQIGIDQFTELKQNLDANQLDHLLWDFARRIHGQLLPGDLLGHGTEGEFSVYLREARATSPAALAALILEALREPVPGSIDNSSGLKCSIGVVPIQAATHPDFESVTGMAASALSQSRTTGTTAIIHPS